MIYDGHLAARPIGLEYQIDSSGTFVYKQGSKTWQFLPVLCELLLVKQRDGHVDGDRYPLRRAPPNEVRAESLERNVRERSHQSPYYAGKIEINVDTTLVEDTQRWWRRYWKEIEGTYSLIQEPIISREEFGADFGGKLDISRFFENIICSLVKFNTLDLILLTLSSKLRSNSKFGVNVLHRGVNCLSEFKTSKSV